MIFTGSYDTSESIEDRLEQIKALQAELAQPDYCPPPHTEEQLDLQLRN